MKIHEEGSVDDDDYQDWMNGFENGLFTMFCVVCLVWYIILRI